MKYKTLVHKISGKYGWVFSNRIITSEIPFLLPVETQMSDIKEEVLLEQLKNYKLIILYVTKQPEKTKGAVESK